MFTTRLRTRFHLADPAGILFFGNVYPLAHDAYEDFIGHLGFSWKEWFANETWAVPIRQSSCEHLRPIRAGSEVEIKIAIEKIGESSFTLRYSFVNEGQTASEVRLVHAFIDTRSFTKMPMPSNVRGRLEAYERECLSAK